MSLQRDSIAGKIRDVLKRMGWDADATDVAISVGLVHRWCSDINAWDDRIPTIEYVNLVRKKFRNMAPKPESLPVEAYEWM